jgi:hypothetical protein
MMRIAHTTSIVGKKCIPQRAYHLLEEILEPWIVSVFLLCMFVLIVV